MSITYTNFGKLLWEQQCLKGTETLSNEVLDTRNRILGVEHPDTVRAVTNLAATYYCIGRYREQRSKFWMQETEFLEWNIKYKW